MRQQLDLADLEDLYSTLTGSERDELLQCLLVAASKEQQSMLDVLEAVLLVRAVRELMTSATGDSAPLGPGAAPYGGR
jgi:hypothetical protein